MSKPFIGSLALAVCLALSLSAPASAASIKVPEGTSLNLQLVEQLSSANAVVGQRFNLKLEEDLRVNGVVVAPHGHQRLMDRVNRAVTGEISAAEAYLGLLRVRPGSESDPY